MKGIPADGKSMKFIHCWESMAAKTPQTQAERQNMSRGKSVATVQICAVFVP